jgi:hypothetical protein
VDDLPTLSDPAGGAPRSDEISDGYRSYSAESPAPTGRDRYALTWLVALSAFGYVLSIAQTLSFDTGRVDVLFTTLDGLTVVVPAVLLVAATAVLRTRSSAALALTAIAVLASMVATTRQWWRFRFDRWPPDAISLVARTAGGLAMLVLIVRARNDDRRSSIARHQSHAGVQGTFSS